MNQQELEKRRAANRHRRQMQVRKQKHVALMAGIFLLLVFAGSLLLRSKEPTPSKPVVSEKPESVAAITVTPAPESQNTLELLAVGDNLIHDRVYKHYENTNGNYIFTGMYDPVKEQIQKADLAVINQETVLTTHMDQVSSYPRFATPCQIGDAIVDAGFDVVLHASNHTMDKDTAMVIETLDYWEETHPEISVLGIHRDQEAAEQIKVFEKNGIKLALLNYTFGFNNRNSSSVPSYLVDVYTRKKAKADVQKAKKLADAVVVFYHVGKEYSEAPTNAIQTEFQFLADLGVDLTIASHPHVIQSCEILTGSEQTSTLTYYSLGNFLAGQKDPKTLLGAMARVIFTKDNKTGEVTIQESEMIPTVSHYDKDFKNLTVYPLADYTDDLAARHGVHDQKEAAGTHFNLNYLQERWAQIQH